MRVVRQRKDGDCGIAALAMYLEQAYEDVYVEAAKEDPRRGGAGLYNREVIAIAGRFGVALRPSPASSCDLDADDGVLRVRFGGRPCRYHLVCVLEGQVLDPTDGAKLPWRDYCERFQATPLTLLRED